jgi:hypothetical protein
LGEKNQVEKFNDSKQNYSANDNGEQTINVKNYYQLEDCVGQLQSIKDAVIIGDDDFC